MVWLSLPPLLDLCGIRIAYLMWTRHEVIKACRSVDNWNNLGCVVLAEVQSLSLPEKLKSLVLKPLKPVGGHLLIFLNSLLSKTQPVNSVNWLTEDMLFECLILNGDGLINQRKTAQKILSSRMLPNVFAFRLACVNFLQVEVLKLWPRVMLYFLNKMMLESEKPHVINDMFSFSKLFGAENKEVPPYHPYFNEIRETDSVSYTTEPQEVLFWITYCMSKEQAMQATPYFEKDDVWKDFSLKSEIFFAEDWEGFILKAAVSSGNVACFDYCNKYWVKKERYSYEEMTQQILSRHQDIYHASFVFHYRLLTSSEIKRLFQLRPYSMTFRFLQWPLSMTFLEKTEEIWNLISDYQKDWVFAILIAILYEKSNIVQLMLLSSFDLRPYTSHYSLLHSFDHIKIIFGSLWNISSDSLKTKFLNTYVFRTILGFYVGSMYERGRFVWQFERNGLKEKLLHLFLENADAVLELYKGETIQASLRNLVIKYMPEYFEDLDRRFIAFLNTECFLYGLYRWDVMSIGLENQCVMDKRGRSTEIDRSYHTWYSINEQFVNHIKEVLLLSNSINNSFVYD